jgi:hypothetical protein
LEIYSINNIHANIYLVGIFYFLIYSSLRGFHYTFPASGRSIPPSQKDVHTIHANGPSQSTPTIICFNRFLSAT